MKNHFDISDSIEITDVDIAGVACTCQEYVMTYELNTINSPEIHLYPNTTGSRQFNK